LGRTIAEGAGVGFGIDDFKVSQVSRSGGTRRLFHVFNPSARRRTQLVEIVVWDWDGDLNRLTFQDAAGQAARHQLLGSGWDNYWGHNFTRVLVEVSAPPCGYTSLVLVETDARLDFITFPAEPRLETSESFRLENGQVCARFDPQSCALVSLVDKPSGEELVDPQRPAVFRIIQEDDRLGMTAWNVGRTMDVHSLVDDVRLLNFDSSGPLRQSLAYAVTTGASRLAVTVSLEAGSSQLEYSVEADWREVGRHGQGVPQLNFQLPTAYACRAYRYDIAFGTIERQPTSQDVPTNSWGVALRQADGGTRAIQVVTESCNAMRGVDNSLALTLIRSSYDPDPYPEVGIHKIRFAVGVVAAAAHNQDLITAAYDYSHPLEVFSGTGSQPTSRGFLSLESASAVLSAIKTPEDRTGDELVVRVYESEGQAAQVKIKFDRTIAQAYLVDLHEQLLNEGKQVEISGEDLEFKVDAYCVATVRVKFS
jgi:alpha-mannosidase